MCGHQLHNHAGEVNCQKLNTVTFDVNVSTALNGTRMPAIYLKRKVIYFGKQALHAYIVQDSTQKKCNE